MTIFDLEAESLLHGELTEKLLSVFVIYEQILMRAHQGVSNAFDRAVARSAITECASLIADLRATRPREMLKWTQEIPANDVQALANVLSRVTVDLTDYLRQTGTESADR